MPAIDIIYIHTDSFTNKCMRKIIVLHIPRHCCDSIYYTSKHTLQTVHITSHHSTANRMALHTPAHTYTHCIAFNCTAYCTALHSRALHGNASFCILHGIAFQCIDCMFIRTLYFTLMYIQYTCVNRLNSLTLHNTTEHELEP